MFTLTLIYSDRAPWLVGSFDTVAAANAWLAQAQKQADWDPTTTAQIVDNTPPADSGT